MARKKHTSNDDKSSINEYDSCDMHCHEIKVLLHKSPILVIIRISNYTYERTPGRQTSPRPNTSHGGPDSFAAGYSYKKDKKFYAY